LQSAGLLFFAFAGYARIATLAEEVKDPARTIPRAISLALMITLIVYAFVAVAALLAWVLLPLASTPRRCSLRCRPARFVNSHLSCRSVGQSLRLGRCWR
jgi:L-asparagine transporter-like permease